MDKYLMETSESKLMEKKSESYMMEFIADLLAHWLMPLL